MKIYLAGKINGNEWRREILGDPESWPDEIQDAIRVDGVWPVFRGVIGGRHDYVGPYFVDCGCGHGCRCAQGPDNHGVSAEEYVHQELYDDRHRYSYDEVSRLCLEAIDRADVVFAWIDRLDVYGTIAELGYAKARQKPIWIAGPDHLRDLWFIYTLADEYRLRTESPATTLSDFLERHRRTQLRDQIDGYVYLLKSGPAYKIGRAREVDARIKQISPVLPYPVEVVHTIPSNNVVRAEAHYHQMFASKRLRGEWFDLSDADVWQLRSEQEALFDDVGRGSTALVRVRQ